MNNNDVRHITRSAIDWHSLRLLNNVPAEALNVLIAFLPDAHRTRTAYCRMVEDTDGRRIAVVFESLYVKRNTRMWKPVRAMLLLGPAPTAEDNA
jgi:hypothetical protein